MNILNETAIDICDVPRVVSEITNRKRKVDKSTGWRWARKGVQGVHLDYIRVGRRIVTSREALARFFTALADADREAQETPTYTPQECQPVTPRRRTPAQRQKAIEQAERELARRGV